MATKTIKLTIDSSLKNVYLIDMIIETLCTLVPLSDDQSFWVKLCVVEAVNNSIIHAYRSQPGQDVEVIFSLNGNRMTIQVCDSGKAMKDVVLKTGPGTGPEDTDDMNAKGRGLAIIREMMDEVRYGTENGRNCLTMTKVLAENR
ncbi:ATP-binding protein [Desulfonema ishimotonii]|uniref:ATP-binding protein n=1 Tax=Desulfonema ishimotonii TaxID=45657 RepID=A0A401FTR7_9BACT|nr:ATP-binding protein [Desulfonema ishimotonii]GBC60356.1 ATP-binding protein [Desulfonema ishimotonii]